MSTTPAGGSANQRIDTSNEMADWETDPAKLPRITVVTPSFNQARYLKQTIQSIIDQKYPNLEWIVVDGGSTDGSVELIKQNEQHFAWWVSEKDRNHPHALNKGYEKATGEIFCFVNSDDTLEPGALHYVASKFTPDVNWVVGWAKYFDNSHDEWVYGPHRTDRPIDFFLHNPVPQISSFWRTSAIKSAGLFTEKYLWAFDYEYWMRLYFVAGWKPVQVRRCLGMFRLHMQSKTLSKPENYGPDFATLHEEYFKYLTPAERAQFEKEKKVLDASRASKAAWDAIAQHDATAARKHAMFALKRRKLSLDAWKTLACAVRGR